MVQLKNIINESLEYKIQYILDIIKTGSYGTPTNPIRSTSFKWTFWAGYFGNQPSTKIKSTILYPFAKAGKTYKNATRKDK